MQDAVFRNSVIDAIASKTEAPTPASRTVRAWEAFYPSMIVTQYIYSHTPATSPLRQLMLDMYVWNASNATWFNDSDREVAPREFLWGFCAAECGKQACSEGRGAARWHKPLRVLYEEWEKERKSEVGV